MLFANDLSLYVPENVTVVQYADDAQLTVTGRKSDMKHLVARIKKAIRSAYQQFFPDGMKDQMLVLGTLSMLRDPSPALKFSGNVIPVSQIINSLGILADHHLTFGTHLDHRSRKYTGIAMTKFRAPRPPEICTKAGRGALVLPTVRHWCPCMGHVVRLSCAVCKNRSKSVVARRKRYGHISGSVAQLG